MAAQGSISGVAIAMVSAGGLFVYAAIQDVPVIDALREIIREKRAPTPGTPTTVLAPPTSSALTGGVGNPTGSGRAGLAGAQGAAIVAEAKRHLGKPYVWGAAGPDRFDCSGLTSYVLIKLGLQERRMVTAQYLVWKGATDVPWSDHAPGDLACWPGHIGIVTGDNQMIHASRAGQPVKYGPIRDAARGVLRIRRVKLAKVSNARRQYGGVSGG